MKRNNVIELGEHVLITGMTGSGKSILAESYLSGYEYVIKLDTKDEVTERRRKGKPLWRGLKENKDYTVVTRLEDIQHVQTKKIIYVPNIYEQNLEYYDLLCKYVYERENTILWVDELMSISTPTKYPPYLKALYTRGRSKDCSVWALTQRPMDIPVIVPSNSTHFFSFRLSNDVDRDKMFKITGMKEIRNNPNITKGDYNFWYYSVGDTQPIRAKLTL